jgi:hypothetical protein
MHGSAELLKVLEPFSLTAAVGKGAVKIANRESGTPQAGFAKTDGGVVGDAINKIPATKLQLLWGRGAGDTALTTAFGQATQRCLSWFRSLLLSFCSAHGTDHAIRLNQRRQCFKEQHQSEEAAFSFSMTQIA